MSHVVVTISRQLGSGGTYIGQEVAKALGMRYVDREILAEAATILREDPEILKQREERVSTFFESLLRTISVGGPDAGYFPPPYPVIYDEQIFTCQARIMRRIALEEDAVIVGRGGYFFLRGHQRAVHVFLHAPRDVRLERTMEIYQVSRCAADEMLNQSDNDRRKFNEKLTRESWGCAHHFHLCIDTDRAGYPLVVETIVSLVRHVRAQPRAER